MERIIAKNKPKNKKLAGFSLLEMIIAIFIFSLVITAAVSVFVASYNAQRKAKEIQLGVEDSRGAIEIMAKNIRMGTIDGTDGIKKEIAFYNYSQGKCIKYAFENGKIMTGELSGSRLENLDCSSISTPWNLIADSIVDDLNFNITESKYSETEDSIVGKVTISIKIIDSKEPIQTTISLRDYNE